MEPFRVGVNYWPARTATGWWAQFDQAVVAADFARIAGSGLDSVRVFLTWEDFQPAPGRVPPKPARTTRPPLSSLARRSRDERATFGVTPPELLAHVT